jgi:ATP-dependent helicase/nuclease subunit A
MTPNRRTPSSDQQLASDPAVSAWVAANAGSGKTTVLVDRVIRLLLDGNEPERILCLTYTKAAAALMANRLFGELARWVTLDDEELRKHLKSIGVARVDHKLLALARRLFTRSLETPGGLKIQTIHAFCERLLQLFPVEAGIVPGFTVMDDMTAGALLANARDTALWRAANEPNSVIGQALTKVAARAQAGTLDDLLKKLLAKRLDIAEICAGSQAVTAACATLRRANGLTAADHMSALEMEFQAFDEGLYRRIAARLEDGSKTERDTAARLRACIGATDKRAALAEAFFTDKHAKRAQRNVMTKPTIDAQPDLWAAFVDEQDRLDGLNERMSALHMIEASEALLHLGSKIMESYGELKRSQGVYDFEDLINNSRDLLTRSGAAQWVLYKLDGGIHHLLIDEAQDTSPAQWQIVRRLTDDFFSGKGAVENVRRTVFAVGDRKQSIFSFQGANPDEFDEARDHFAAEIAKSGEALQKVPLTISHRSVPAVLAAVEATFASAVAAQGLLASGEESFPVHQPVRIGQAGLVEIWPLEEPEEKEAPQPFQAPVDRPPVNHPRRKLARRIAGTIAGWLDEKRYIAALGRPVRPGDILILVRSRSTLADALQSELRGKGVPVAGADRLKLAEHIAVQDLLALGRFCANQEDDYSLACLLKSPLIRRDDGKPFDDDDLFALANGRGKASLWQRLAASEAHAAIRSVIADFIDLAGELTPFALFARVLTRCRMQILARLGPDAAEPLDAFLDMALDFEMDNTPTLTGFLAWFLEAGAEIKRDMEQEGGEVRIMTVHGAKGLEANVVFLADAAEPLKEPRGVKLLFAEAEDGDAAKFVVPFWKLGNMRTPRKVEEWIARRKTRELEEHRRLFYVAMTRARDELYICGCGTEKNLKPESWYAMALTALGSSCDTDSEGKRRLASPQVSPVPSFAEEVTATPAAASLPIWARTGVGLERAAGAERGETLFDAKAAERGRVIHHLLDTLPRLAAAERRPAARRYLKRIGADEALAEAVTAIFDDRRFAHLFAGEGLSEVPYAGAHGAGRIDRLFLSEREALILDFKSDRAPPSAPEDIPPAYLRQIARYRDAVKRMGGEREVRAAILWTAGPRLMEIPSAMLAGQG